MPCIAGGRFSSSSFEALSSQAPKAPAAKSNAKADSDFMMLSFARGTVPWLELMPQEVAMIYSIHISLHPHAVPLKLPHRASLAQHTPHRCKPFAHLAGFLLSAVPCLLLNI